MSARRTMYMHTLDGRPAGYDDLAGPYIYFAAASRPVPLVPTLRQIRAEQRKAQRDAAKRSPGSEWADPTNYGYIRVEVPA